MSATTGREDHRLASIAAQCRLAILDAVFRSGVGHVASSLSCLDILVWLFHEGRVLRGGTNGVGNPLLLSKGHAAEALYSVQASVGLREKSWPTSYCQPGGLSGHPDTSGVGVLFQGGPLGLGLATASGIALGLTQIDNRRVFVVSGDGELGEGSMWEAARFAADNGLSNLQLIVDCNGLRAGGRVSHSLSHQNLRRQFEAFGWQVCTIDGHSFSDIRDSIRVAGNAPKAILALTVKGKGVSFMENTARWHNRVPTQQEYERARSELFQRSLELDGTRNEI